MRIHDSYRPLIPCIARTQDGSSPAFRAPLIQRADEALVPKSQHRIEMIMLRDRQCDVGIASIMVTRLQVIDMCHRNLGVHCKSRLKNCLWGQQLSRPLSVLEANTLPVRRTKVYMCDRNLGVHCMPHGNGETFFRKYGAEDLQGSYRPRILCIARTQAGSRPAFRALRSNRSRVHSMCWKPIYIYTLLYSHILI